MTTTAPSTDHFLNSPRRNLIWIPMDLYRKYTESSCSSSSSSSLSSPADLSPANCSWHSSPSSKTKHSLRDRQSRGCTHRGRHSSSRSPSTLVQGKVSKTRSSTKQHQKHQQQFSTFSSSRPLPAIAKEQFSSSSSPSSSSSSSSALSSSSLTFSSTYPTPSPEEQLGTTTLATLFATTLSPSLPRYDMLPMSISETDPLSTYLATPNDSSITYPSFLFSSPSPPSPPSSHAAVASHTHKTKASKASKASKATDQSESSLLHQSLVPPKKRKRDHHDSEQTTTTPSTSQAVSPSHQSLEPFIHGSQGHKRLRQSPSKTETLASKTTTISLSSAKRPREVIVISDDEPEDIVTIDSDDDDANESGDDTARQTAVSAVSAAFPSPNLSISSPSSLSTLSSVTHLSTLQSTAVPGPIAIDPVAEQSSSTSANHKYELDRHSRHLVETIFPAHEEAGSKAVLERALATSRKLRDEFIIDRFLGSGCSGFVLAAKRVQDGKNVAIKVIPHTADLVETKVRRELDILVSLKSHENVLEFVDYFTSSLYGDVDPDDRSNTDISYIVTEMGGNSLFDFIELHKPAEAESCATTDDLTKYYPQGSGIQTSVIRSIFTQLSLALHSLHSQNIVHGDIKDENALISMDSATNTYRAKICDFGHSKHVGDGCSPSFAFYGTTILAPPEMDANIARRERERARKQGDNINGTKGGRRGTSSPSSTARWEHFYGYEADVWAMGLLLFTMVHGDLPAELRETDAKRKAAYHRKRRSARSFPFALEKNMDNDLKDLLKKMLAVDPSRRLTISQVLAHPWMTKDE